MILTAVFTIFIFVNIFGAKCDQNLLVDDKNNSMNEDNSQEESMDIQDSPKNNFTTLMDDNNTSVTVSPSTYCRQFKKCSDCNKSSLYKCGWCHDFGCTDSPSLLCPKTKLDKTNFEGASCPKIYIDGKEILIPSGVRTNLKVKLRTPDPVVLDKEIICQVRLTDRLTHLKGLIMGDTVYCYPAILRTKVNELVDIGTIELIWGGVSPVSNEIPVIVYKCEAMGVTCEACKMIPVEYGCGWCEGSESCVIGDKCSYDFMRWTLNRMMCNDYQKKLLFV